MSEVVKMISLCSRKRREEHLCEQHEEKVKLFCAEERRPTFVVCDGSQNHRSYIVIPIQNATHSFSSAKSGLRNAGTSSMVMIDPTVCWGQGSQSALPIGNVVQDNRDEFDPLRMTFEKVLTLSSSEQKKARGMDELKVFRIPLRNELVEIQKLKLFEQKKAENVMNETEIKKQKVESELEKLHQFLNEEQRIILSKLKQEEKNSLQRIWENVTQLEEQNSSLMQLISEVEGKSQRSTAELQSDVKDTLNRCQKMEISKPEVAPIEMEKHSQLSSPQKYIILKKMITKFGDLQFSELDWWMRIGRYAVNVTLDPETAQGSLILSEDWKSVKAGNRKKDVIYFSTTIDDTSHVFGCESFTSGRHYWEVEVGNKTEWILGLREESSIGLLVKDIDCELNYKWGSLHEFKNIILFNVGSKFPMPVSLQAVGIFLDYEEGRVSFYNADNKSHLHTFTCSFTGKLRPFFSPGVESAGALKIRSVLKLE